MNPTSKIELTTSNGCVNIDVPQKSSIYYLFKIKNNTTNMNAITDSLNLDKRFDNGLITASTSNINEAEKKCSFNITTSNGYVFIN